MARPRRDLQPEAASGVDPTQGLVWLRRFCMASEGGSDAEAIHLRIRDYPAAGKPGAQLADLWDFLGRIGVADAARRFVDAQQQAKERGQAAQRG